MKTFHLTSPHMKGDDVAKIQRALNAKGYGPLLTDGEYGPATAAEVKKAKYALGYALRRVDRRAGQRFYDLLTGAKRLPTTYALRARARKRKLAATTTMGERAFANLERKIGTKENPPNSNRCWASIWYGIIGPWCAMCVTWAYVLAGSKAFLRAVRYAYVPNILADAISGRNGLSITHEPRKGDPSLFDWDNDRLPDHVELFEKWLDRTRGIFQTVGGNTGPVDKSNGGEVLRNERYMSDLQAFVRVSK